MQQQAAVKRTENIVNLVNSCTPSPSHSQRRGTSRPRLNSSGAVSQRPWCLRRRRLDNDDLHHSRTVVMLQRAKTDQIDHAISVFTRTKCSRHFSGSQPVGLLQRCLRWSSSLRHPATTVSAQQNCTFSSRSWLIATSSCILSAARPSLAAC